MKVAATFEAGEIFPHFGHCRQFKIYEVENGGIVSEEIVDTQGNGHGALAGFLKGLGVNALICGGIGGGARQALEEAGIRLYPGVSGEADKRVEELLNGSLEYDPDTVCSHHHEGEEHQECRSHSCSEDKKGCPGN